MVVWRVSQPRRVGAASAMYHVKPRLSVFGIQGALLYFTFGKILRADRSEIFGMSHLHQNHQNRSCLINFRYVAKFSATPLKSQKFTSLILPS